MRHILAKKQTIVLLILLLAATSCGGVSARSNIHVLSQAAPLVHLPADQASHPASKNEWWYVVGHLHSGARTFGYEMTIFKFNHVRPPGFTTPLNLYRTDVAVTDESGRHFYSAITPYLPGSASASTTALNVQAPSASLSGPVAGMRLKASLPRGRFNFQLRSLRPTMYVGGRGYLSFGNGFTYYYSLTDLQTSGALRLAGKKYAVSGVSWLDHQWGNWSWTTIRGWTWMALQLGNGVQLSVFDFHSSLGRVAGVSVLPRNGQTRALSGLSITPNGTWVSPHTAGRYPSGWIVRIPKLKAVLHVTPTIPDQELVLSLAKAGSYWEGSGRVHGTFQGRPVTGLSYTELTGFAPRQ